MKARRFFFYRLSRLKKPRTDDIQKFLKKNFFFSEYEEENKKKPKCFAQHYHEKNKANKQLILLFVNKIFVHLLYNFREIDFTKK